MYFVVVIVVGCSIMNTIWRYCSVCASLTDLLKSFDFASEYRQQC